MGWKTLKDHFNIEGHIVFIKDGLLCIGSGFVTELATINLKTGELKESDTFGGFLKQQYPELLATPPERLFELISAEDKFEKSIKIYTYKGGEIIEKFCETPFWPNVTHDGCLIFENLYSTEINKVIDYAKANAKAAINLTSRSITETEENLKYMKADLDKYKEDLSKLESLDAEGWKNESVPSPSQATSL